jgi:hypothetical protein
MKREVFTYVAVAAFVGLVLYFLIFSFGAKKPKNNDVKEEEELKKQVQKEIEEKKSKELKKCKYEPLWNEGDEDITEGNSSLDITQIIALGDYSVYVSELQSRLNKNYGSKLKIDGKFGCVLFAEIQEKAGLNAVSLGGIQLSDIKE